MNRERTFRKNGYFPLTCSCGHSVGCLDAATVGSVRSDAEIAAYCNDCWAEYEEEALQECLGV
jgi:hypothetical protein